MNSKYPGQHPQALTEDLRCGSCQWYKTGYGNHGFCADRRQVEAPTYGCVEHLMVLADNFDEVAKDKYVLGIRENLKHARFNLDDSLLDELRSYIVEDDFGSNHFGTQQDLNNISQYLRKVVVSRSRVSIIYTSLLDTKYEFEELQEHSAMWLLTKYPVMTGLKNEAIRKATMDRLMPERIVVRKKLKKLLNVAEYIDKKLDAAEFSLTKILSSSERLLFSKERAI